MIAISSRKPDKKCTDEVRANQEAAFKSWQSAFTKIIFVNKPTEHEPTGGTTLYLPAGDRPTIAQMAYIASTQTGWVAMLNADIIVLPKMPAMEKMLHKMGAACGVSRRWDPKEGRVIDGGLDFFCALPHVWGTVAERIPKEFTIGRIVWDTWLLNYLSAMYTGVFYDLTPWAFVYHPKHEGREDQNWEYPKDDHFLQVNHWPKFMLPV